MSLYDNFDNVAEGDEVKVSRGRSRERIAKVYHVTPKQFKVEGFDSFWKHNGKGVGDASCFYGSWAEHIQPGDKKRIAAIEQRVADVGTFKNCETRRLNDDELAAIACIIKASELRREGERGVVVGEVEEVLLGPVMNENELSNR